MNGLYITVDGVVGTDPKRSVWNGNPIISFRFVTKERRYDRAKGCWVDGHSSWMSVTCFRALAKNVDESVCKGDRLIVHGRVRVKDYVTDNGTQRTTVDLEADSVGHNLMFGTARFRPAKTAENLEEQIRAQADELMRELADQPLEDVETLIAQRVAHADDDPDDYDSTEDPDEDVDDDPATDDEHDLVDLDLDLEVGSGGSGG
ncbi:MAG TPA: single-stranded DNA-binding protein, partial [Kineosporiaceae bacterium]|nr:single-stranded DNA-binding protein [Kineosporiaceae bacterium]